MTDALLTQADAEDEILRISQILDEQTHSYGAAVRRAAKAEADYRIAYARAFTKARLGEERVAEKTADQMAVVECAALLLERRSAEAEERYLEEQCRSLRSRLDAVRTISANVRAQT